jgi:hypothetical protein
MLYPGGSLMKSRVLVTVVCFTLAAAGLAQARQYDGVFSTGSYEVSVESLVLLYPDTTVSMETRGWGGGPDVVDTFSLEFERPLAAQVWFTADGQPDNMLMAEPFAEDTWYVYDALPPVSPMVWFHDINSGVEDRGRVLSRVGLRAGRNPARGSVLLTMSLGRADEACIEVFDGTGQVVRTLSNACLPAGERSFVWDGSDSRGRKVGTGIYLVRLTTGADRAFAKVVLTD